MSRSGGTSFSSRLRNSTRTSCCVMARQATADDLAIEDVEGGKQGSRPVPFVVMRLTFGIPGRNGRRERLGLMPESGSFIDTEHEARQAGRDMASIIRTLSQTSGSFRDLEFPTRCAGCHGVARDAAPSCGRRLTSTPERARSSGSHQRVWSSALCPESAAPVPASGPCATASAFVAPAYRQCRV